MSKQIPAQALAEELAQSLNQIDEQFIVICGECSQEHLTTEVEFLNVEEDIHGHDVMYFVCPITKTETKSKVYRK
jgi:hypothetical protein